MPFELTQLRTLRTILLSTVVLSGCADGGGTEEQATLLRHEQGPAHAHPAADAGAVSVDAGRVAAPVNCLPNTYDQIQASIFDAPKYGCTQSFCHGSPGGHINLRAGFSYDSLLGLAHADDDAHDNHAHTDESAPHVHDTDAPVDESVPHEHAPGAEHLVLADEEGAPYAESGTGHTHEAHVIPGNAEASVLFDRLRAKVQGTQPVMGGTPMPLGPTPISKGELKAIELWIKAGAPRSGFVAGTEGACPEVARR